MRFGWRIFAGTLLVVLVTTLLVERQVVTRVSSARLEVIEQRVQDDVWTVREVVREMLADGERANGDVESRLQALAHEVATYLPGRRLTIIAADGRVMADSHEDPALMDNHGSRPEVLDPGTIVERDSRTLRQSMMYVALPVEHAGQPWGTVRVALASHDIEGEVASMQAAIRAGAAVALLVGAVLAWLLSRRVAAPLARAYDVLDALGRGEYDRRLQIDGRDEIGQLAEVVNRMADQLAEREASLVAEMAQKGAILSSMDEGVLAVDEEERVVLLNEAAARLLGTRRDQALGHRLSELTRIPEVLEALARSVSGKDRVTREFADEGRVVLLRASPLTDRDGRLVMCVLVLHDLTELRRLEKMRSDFVANVSHELKTPLTAMRGYLEALTDDPQMPADLRQSFLEKAVSNTTRLADIVSDLLELARIEAEQGTLRRDDLDLSRIVEACVEASLEPAAMRGVQLSLGGAAGPLRVCGDERALAAAITNLIDNAIKYSPEGGSVPVELRADNASAWVEVGDQGPGVPLHEQERIFERFYRVDKNRDRKLGGTGLGLSIVRNVARAHGGEASVTSVPGVGSTFRIRLPLERARRPLGSPVS